jgi:D-tyrosyl-tRNA(Tyr) deacylase
MRLVIQRVTRASVSVEGKVVSSIGPGLMCLVGLRDGDARADLELMCKKVLKARLFENEAGQSWKASVSDIDAELLCVSQFTLYGRVKSNKPDFSRAMPPTQVHPLSVTVSATTAPPIDPNPITRFDHHFLLVN